MLLEDKRILQPGMGLLIKVELATYANVVCITLKLFQRIVQHILYTNLLILVNITQWNSSWLAYIRQARTWLETYPYVASGANTVSRDDGKGTNCTGFVATVFREMEYNLYYGNFPADGINVLTTSTSWGGGPYMQKDGKETSSDPKYYTVTKQSNILAWWELAKGYFTHVTIATYKTSDGWWIIHPSAAHKGVYEEVIPSGYKTMFDKPTVYHWIDIGRGN